MIHDVLIRPATALHYAKYGHSKQQLLALLSNKWDLTPEEINALELQAYYLLQWEGKYLAKQIVNGTVLDSDGYEYAVVYRSCTPSSAFKSEQIRISFRQSALGNFAIVQPCKVIAGQLYGVSQPSGGNKL